MYLDPAFVTRLIKPLVDHRLAAEGGGLDDEFAFALVKAHLGGSGGGGGGGRDGGGGGGAGRVADALLPEAAAAGMPGAMPGARHGVWAMAREKLMMLSALGALVSTGEPRIDEL